MNIIKRFSAIALTLLIIITSVSSLAFADPDEVSENASEEASENTEQSGSEVSEESLPQETSDEESNSEESPAEESAEPVYVTVTLTSSGNGSVTMSAGEKSGSSLSVLTGTTVTVSVATETDNSITSLTVGGEEVADASGKAYYTHTFTAEADTEVSVQIDPDTSIGRDITFGTLHFCTASLSTTRANVGAQVTVTVKPNLVSIKLTQITVNGTKISFSDNKATFTVGEAEECVVAVTCMSLYALVLEDAEHGTLSASPNEDNLSYIIGSRVSISLTPEEGYVLKEVYVTVDGNDPVNYYDQVSNGKITITTTDRETHVSATFVKGYAANVTVVGGGSVSPNQKYFLPDSTVDFKFNAADGYLFKSLTVDGVEVTAHNASYALLMDSDKEITVEFEKAVKLTPNITAGGKVYVNGTEITGVMYVKPGIDVTIICTPGLNYKLGAMYLNGILAQTGAGNAYTISSISDDTRITVKFDVANSNVTTYTVSASAGDHGEVSPSGVSTVVEGDSVVFNFLPDEGYKVDTVTVNGKAVTVRNNTYTLSEIYSNITLSVTFTQGNNDVQADRIINLSDIDWTSSVIVLDISRKDYISKEVFDRLAIESLNKAIVFDGGGFRFTVPEGSDLESISEPYVQLSAAADDEADFDYEEIVALIKSKVESLTFVVMTVYTDYAFPSGTVFSYNMGALYAGENMNYLVYTDGTLSTPKDLSGNFASNSAEVDENGWVSVHYYNDDHFILCEKLGTTYNIISSASSGGFINPAGTKAVSTGDDAVYTVTAYDGYKIKSVLVDGVEVTEASGLKKYVYTFERVSSAHTISATFEEGEPIDREGGVDSGLIVSLIIVFLSVAAAAGLLIYRWRQEKY